MRRGTTILKELDHWEDWIVEELEEDPKFEENITKLCDTSIVGLSEWDIELIKLNALLRLRNIHAETY